jgi:hypothetical protein
MRRRFGHFEAGLVVIGFSGYCAEFVFIFLPDDFSSSRPDCPDCVPASAKNDAFTELLL